MNCTKCEQPIQKGQPYARTKRGPHHFKPEQCVPEGVQEAPQPEQLAHKFHESYERLAPYYGYKTKTESAKPWKDVPEENRSLMIAVCKEIIKFLVAQAPLREAPLRLTSALQVILDLAQSATPIIVCAQIANIAKAALNDVAPLREAAQPIEIYGQDGACLSCGVKEGKIHKGGCAYCKATEESVLREAATPPYWTLKLLSDLFENCDLGNTLDARREFIDKATPIVEKHFGRLADSSALSTKEKMEHGS